MGLYSDRAASLGSLIREAGRKAEADRAGKATADRPQPETPEQALTRLAAQPWVPLTVSPSLRAVLGLADPIPSTMERAG